MHMLYKNDKEYRQHVEAINSIAHQYHLSTSTVREIYEDVLSQFVKQAKFRTYLIILVSRRVKDLLRSAKNKTGNRQ